MPPTLQVSPPILVTEIGIVDGKSSMSFAVPYLKNDVCDEAQIKVCHRQNRKLLLAYGRKETYDAVQHTKAVALNVDIEGAISL